VVGATASPDAVARAKRMPRLRVGLHLTIVKDKPVLPAGEIPDLVDATGHLRSDLVSLGIAIMLMPGVRRQVRGEIRAQFEAFKATGLALDHVNAHLHYHLHPAILGEILAIGVDYGMCALRVPIEPSHVLRAIEPTPLRPAGMLVGPWAALMRGRTRKAGFISADQVFGLAWSGRMTEERIVGLIDNLPNGSTEIYTHPALSGGYKGAAPGYSYADELAALVSARCREALARSQARVGGYVDLSEAA
jgi:hopanoid biosynthesis associated protein HpnK